MLTLAPTAKKLCERNARRTFYVFHPVFPNGTMPRSSADTQKYHRQDENGVSFRAGQPPDERMTAAAKKRGLELTGVSRALRLDDLEDFDLVIGMVSRPLAFE